MEGREILGKVIIEAKNQSINSDDKTRHDNDYFYDKLLVDSNNRNGNFSILVSNLEWDRPFSVYLPNSSKYKNMFVVRPNWLMPLLSLLWFIITQKAKLEKDIENNKKINFDEKTIENIRTNFETFKKQVLDEEISSIDDKFKNTEKLVNRIIKAANLILKNEKSIINTHFKKIKDKISKFNIDDLSLTPITNLQSEIDSNDDDNEIDKIAAEIED